MLWLPAKCSGLHRPPAGSFHASPCPATNPVTTCICPSRALNKNGSRREKAPDNQATAVEPERRVYVNPVCAADVPSDHQRQIFHATETSACTDISSNRNISLHWSPTLWPSRNPRW